MSAYYNENDPYAAEWLRNLAAQGHIAQGDVDARSIRDVGSGDLRGWERALGRQQAHFFAGIGAWSYALRLAGWPDDAPVWTGSCPCQPFSQAGRRKGTADERHLWPEWFRLIQTCKPPVVFGEQVANPDGLNWLDTVLSDLEGAGYEVGAADLCAAGVGAPHLRQRLYFVAVSREQRRQGFGLQLRSRSARQAVSQAPRGGAARELGNTGSARGGRDTRAILGQKTKGDLAGVEARRLADVARAPGQARGLGNAGSARPQERPGDPDRQRPLRIEGAALAAPGALRGPWTDADLLWCRDGKYRPVEPGLEPVVNGAPARVGRLRAYGNAIVPEVAATFVRAVIDCLA